MINKVSPFLYIQRTSDAGRQSCVSAVVPIENSMTGISAPVLRMRRSHFCFVCVIERVVSAACVGQSGRRVYFDVTQLLKNLKPNRLRRFFFKTSAEQCVCASVCRCVCVLLLLFVSLLYAPWAVKFLIGRTL